MVRNVIVADFPGATSGILDMGWLAAWKSREWSMSVWLTSVTTHSSPGWPRRTGAGTCPLKVHMSWVTPGAAWVSLFSATRMTWWMVAAGPPRAKR